MSITVRPCESLADVAAIETTEPTGPSGFHQKRFERNDGSTYLLAWLDGVAVGHVLVTPESKYAEVRDGLGRFPEVNALGVSDAYRRRGAARALMETAVSMAVHSGRLGLAVEAENERALRLYDSLGFERHPTIKPVDVWSWTDDDGHTHEQRDACTYWMLIVSSS